MTSTHITAGSNPRLGIMLILVATIVLSCMDALTKILAAVFEPPQILVVRWAVFLTLALLMAARGGGIKRAMRSKRPVLQIARALLLVIEIGVFIVAFGNLQLAEVHAIGASAPLLITALSVPFLNEKVGIRRWLSVAVGFLGVVIILRPGFGMVNPYHLVTLGGVVLWSSYQIMTRMVGREDSPETSMFYLGAVGFVVLIVVAPFFWRPPTASEWAMLAPAGALGAIGHFLIIKALSLAAASTLQPFTFASFVWAIVLGWLVFEALPDAATVLGAGIIIASGLYIFHREHYHRHRPLAETLADGLNKKK